jgi:hypothetical protein
MPEYGEGFSGYVRSTRAPAAAKTGGERLGLAYRRYLGALGFAGLWRVV